MKVIVGFTRVSRHGTDDIVVGDGIVIEAETEAELLKKWREYVEISGYKSPKIYKYMPENGKRLSV